MFIDNNFNIYQVNTNILEQGIGLIKRYENHVYDLYGGETWSEDDTWGWWNYCEYKEIGYDDIEFDEEICDLTDYVFRYPLEFCKRIYKGTLNE